MASLPGSCSHEVASIASPEPAVATSAHCAAHADPSHGHPTACCAQELADMIALMLMIRINHEHRRIMNKRRVPCLDDYLDRVHLLLWPKLKVGSCAALQLCVGGCGGRPLNMGLCADELRLPARKRQGGQRAGALCQRRVRPLCGEALRSTDVVDAAADGGARARGPRCVHCGRSRGLVGERCQRHVQACLVSLG
jgi:hypothetical protein